MNENVRMPIVTVREGNKITKICVEDVYKMLNRIIEPLDNARNYLDRFDSEYEGFKGSLIVGKGVSQNCLIDAFDEEIGNNIAFMKAKLKINLKKQDLLVKEYFKILDILAVIEEEGQKIESLIRLDIEGIKKYNPSFNNFNYNNFFDEVQEQTEETGNED